MIKLSRAAANQYLSIPASSTAAFPLGSWALPFTINFDGLVTGDNPQYILGTGLNPPDQGAINIVLRTAGSTGFPSKLQVYLGGLSAAALQTTAAYSSGIHQFVLRKVGLVMHLLECPILTAAPVDASAMSVQATYTLAADRAFAAPAGIVIGAPSSLAANRMLDQAISRIGRYDGDLTDLEVARLAYGMTLKQLGKTPTWYIGMETLDDVANTGSSTDVVTVHGTPTEVDDPAYGYVAPKWGTFKKPYCADSPWNSTPIDPVFGDIGIPAIWNSKGYYMEPRVANGAYSTGCYRVESTDPAQVITPSSDTVHLADQYPSFASVTLPHWNSSIAPASGTDGHCDAFDEANDLIYSFFNLKNPSTGVWTAHIIGWSQLSGYGFGDGAHYLLGGRAAGVASCAGLIREEEINDGAYRYDHALCMSLDYSGEGQGFILPATACDSGQNLNKGGIPEGALVGLPASFSETDYAYNAEELKLIRSLKPGGKMAYNVDRNENTPYVFYVQNGCTPPVTTATGLHRIRAGMRMMESCSGFLNGDGQPQVPMVRNLLSMRGGYSHHNGTTGDLCVYNTYLQGVEFPETTLASNCLQGGVTFHTDARLRPVIGKTYRITAYGGGFVTKARLSGPVDSGFLAPGQFKDVVWKSGSPYVEAQKAAGSAGWVGLSMIEI